MSDLISRKAAIDAIMGEYPEVHYRDWYASIIKELPSAQPEYRMDEWCTDCKEYDHERHCCPRFNHVIRTTLQEVQAEQPEIVRCKDCKHWVNHKRLNIPWCRELHIDRGAEDFCSMAERRTDERSD